MKIAVVSDTGSSGGAAIAANRLVSKFREQCSAEVKWIYRIGDAPWASSHDSLHKVPYRLSRVGDLKRRLPTVENRHLENWCWKKYLSGVVANYAPDIVWMHNIHGAKWPVELAETLSLNAPVVWTLHDEWVLTGSCAYRMGCEKHLSLCSGRCPQQGVYPTRPSSQVSQERRRRVEIFGRSPNISLVAPSNWLLEQVREALPRSHSRLISYYVDDSIFKIKEEPRREGCPRLLFASIALDDSRKGGSVLLKALEKLDDEFELHLMGGGSVPKLEGRKVINHGFVTSQSEAAAIYQSVDLFLHPSFADNEPQTIKEAMLCGVPVVAFDHTGVHELVDGSGYLSAEPTVEGLVATLRHALSVQKQWRSRGAEGAKKMQVRSSYLNTIAQYERLFEALL